MNEFFKIDKRILDASDKALKLCKEQFENIEKITEYNQQKVQKAFIDNRISETHFGTSTGYGYGDIGRETLDKVWAQVLGAESALVRHNFTCGTHTLATALFGVLRPGDNMLCVSGTPYDTIHNVIGISGEGMGSLKEFGVNYDEVALKNERLDFESIENAVNSSTTMVYIQRSRGYELRPSLSVDEIGKVCEIVKKKLKASKCHIHLYGSDRENKLAPLLELIEQRDLSDIISFHGPVFGKEKAKVLSDADFFIITSRFEGHPMGLLEALAYGLPSLVTTGSNMRLEVETNKAGWGADNNAVSVASAFERLLADVDNYQKMSQNACKLAEMYSWDAIAQKSHVNYIELLQKRRREK